ncbi:MAG: 30S ribosomal protein S6 [Deltaproteobacteria bacterium]|nr:30S ribosomal protein S6 [Deltaproteobacteria bacterium]
MRKYETIVVFNPSLAEAAVKDEVKKFEKLLDSRKAQNVKVDVWGRKQIAYSVKKNSFGNFVCFTYECDDHAIASDVSSQLRISDPVIKFQSHRINEKVRKFKGNPKRKPGSSGDDEFGDSSLGDY